MIQVVAAILEQHGQIFIGRRSERQSHPLQWEFPGGKVEPGESPEQALTRELEEELGIRNATGHEILRYTFQYPNRTAITLIFFRILTYDGELGNLIYPETRWVKREELSQFDFVKGDRQFLDWFTSMPAAER